MIKRLHPKYITTLALQKLLYKTTTGGQEAEGTGDRKQGVLGTGSRGYWGQEAGGGGGGTGAPHTLLVDNQRSVKLVIDFIIILSDHIHIS